jgi:hypothetical protein
MPGVTVASPRSNSYSFRDRSVSADRGDFPAFDEEFSIFFLKCIMDAVVQLAAPDQLVLLI